MRNLERYHVAPGTYYVSTSKPLILKASLGTCVGLALYDQENRIGGLLHLLLDKPPLHAGNFQPEKYATTGLPLFFDALLSAGASAKNLKAWIAGGTLAGGVAHDFNNILLAMMANAELVQMNVPKESTVHDRLKNILSAGMRGKNIVRQILTYTRQAEIQTEPVQVCAIVEETLRLLSSSLPTNIEIQQDIQSDAMAMADATHIHQIVMNLCTNASQAMLDTGGVLGVRLSEVQIDEEQPELKANLIPGKYIILKVSDTGHGIPMEVRHKIFDPFFTTKKKGEGTGMGLSVTFGIVKQYGGIVKVTSEPGNGATFQVYLPISLLF